MQKLLGSKTYLLVLFSIMILTMSFLTYLLKPHGQVGILFIVLILLVAIIGLTFGTVASLGLTLVLYFIIGSAFFFVTLPMDKMFPIEIPTLYLFVWMVGVLFAALLSGVTSYRVQNVFQENRDLEVQIQTLIATDALTGFDNKERLMFELEAEFNRSKRYGHTFAFLMFKMQNYEQFYQLYGADEERRLLHHISEEIYDHTRKSDQRFRVETDTFAILLTDTPVEHIEIVQKKVDDAIRTFRLKNNKLVTLSFEYGVAGFDKTNDSYEEVYEAAKEQVERHVA